MKNDALKQMKQLDMLQGDAQDAAVNLGKLQQGQEQQRRVSGDDAEADFATPEALATAVAAGFVLGPIGGLLAGVAQGFLMKEEKQNILDQMAADQDIINQTGEIFNSRFDQLEESEFMTPEDLETLGVHRTQFERGQLLAGSADPAMQAEGFKQLDAAMSGLASLTTTNEAQRIKRNADDLATSRELTTHQQGVNERLRDDYNRDSANYKTVVKNSNIARELINRGNPVDIIGALIQVNKALDPISVVRPEEAKALGNVGTKIEQAMSKLDEWVGSGVAIGDEQRKELLGLLDTIDTTNNAVQMRTDLDYQQFAVDDDLPARYVQQYRTVDNLPAFKETEFIPRDSQGTIDGVQDIIKSAAGSFEPPSIQDQAQTNPRIREAQRRMQTPRRTN